MPVGPQLPPSLLEKRKRSHDDESNSDTSGSDSNVGPLPSTAQPAVPKKARVLGPTLPPAPLETKPPLSPSSKKSSGEDDSDSDDEFGPSPPHSSTSASKPDVSDSVPKESSGTSEATTKLQRDDWMMVPPSSGDWSARVDPTKMKNRKFNTGKGSKAPPSGGDAGNSWHETPAEKQARLQREMMGIKDTSNKPSTKIESSSKTTDAETARRLQQYNKARGAALYESHQAQKTEEDDDPSARAFDREKDIGGGLQINATQRKDMLRKAADFGSRFSTAKYL